MNLSQILKNINPLKINVSTDIEINHLTFNSTEVNKGSLFFAIRGENNDGNNYIFDAIAKGAVAIVTSAKLNEDVPYILVDDVRETMSLIAGNFYNNRHAELKMIALVGTNGKTTTSHMIGEILKTAGHRVSVVGTIGAYIDGEKIDIDLTTPDPIELHSLIEKSYNKGVTHFVFEASEHAIYLKKLKGIHIDIVVYTNFSQDHLDFFKTMEAYKDAVISYFKPENMKFAIINIDDELGIEIARNSDILYTSYGLNSPADTFAVNIINHVGTKFVVNNCDEILDISSNFYGEFNVYNSLGAISSCLALGVTPEAIIKAYKSMQPVSGRFNILASDKQGFIKRVVVDYAHTPDGLKNLLVACRSICSGKLMVVFGCGGSRDPLKRPLMGKISAEYADFTILTSDNSRFENPEDILLQIEQGHKEINKNYIKIVERENAISYALLLAKENDLVVIAGKGGENYMEENGIKREYSDTKVVEDIFKRYNL